MPDGDARRSVWCDQPPMTVALAEREEAFGFRLCHGRDIDSDTCPEA